MQQTLRHQKAVCHKYEKVYNLDNNLVHHKCCVAAAGKPRKV